ncbi:MAG: ATP-binding protein [Deltaproteobacteria bacterium]|nr:ATP-binding protein [Deltaproteobacteria bacterium]MBN2673698.1 ATP-binding protein [Deltaproteobacteria bacterium]
MEHKARYIERHLDIKAVVEKKSCFLFGPRQTGKSMLMRHVLPQARVYNLLRSDLFLRLSANPSQLRQEVQPGELVIIDEIQRIPELLNEVHYCIEEKHARFLLSGSSARKLRRGGVNLLGGRARHRRLHPFVYKELAFDNLHHVLQYGLLPPIVASDSPKEDLRSYTGDYLTEEIAQEGVTRNIPAFSRFLEVAAQYNGQMLNFTNIGSDAQVPTSTVRLYFQILEDTLIAQTVPAWRKTTVRKPITTAKFYFFDIGVARTLQHRDELPPNSPEYGVAFESFIYHEISSYISYQADGVLHYWRSKSNFEVDFIFNEAVAIEVKAKSNIDHRDLKGIRALKEEGKLSRYIVVSLVEFPAVVDEIEILPWKDFLHCLWAGDLD